MIKNSTVHSTTHLIIPYFDNFYELFFKKNHNFYDINHFYSLCQCHFLLKILKMCKNCPYKRFFFLNKIYV